MTDKLLTEYCFEFLSLKGDCTCLSESIYVKMPHCWKSHVMAHIIINEVGNDLPSVPNDAPPLINVFNICNFVSSARFKADTPNTGTTDMDVAKFFNGSLGLRVRNFLTTVSSCLHLFLLARVSIIITTFSRPNEPKLFGISVK